ncbi:MAG: cutinase family protein, partial [Mycobacterium sp.]|nr:cutinase family protein [Mycobacterium sp.]
LVPGTGETNPIADPRQQVGMLAPIAQGLRSRYGSDIDVRTLPYPAAPVPYHASESGGVQSLSTALAGLCSQTRVVMAGYSQGADTVGDEAAAIGNGRGPIPASRVVGVGLISDPKRAPGTPQLGTPASGQGIAGPRAQSFGVLADRVRTVCATGDIYCATTPQHSPALSALGRAFTGNAALTVDQNQSQNQGQASDLVGKTGSVDPASVTQQVVSVLSGLTGFSANLPKLVTELGLLPHLVSAGDIAGLHRVSGEVNNLVNPLVRTAAGIDLHLVARALSMAAPMDTSGWTGVAAQIVNILGNVDLNRVATDVGQLQEIAWGTLQKLTQHDPVGGGLTAVGATPVAADLAATAASALGGSNAAQLTGLAQTFTRTTDPATTHALGDLARQGGDAARFATSGVHQRGYRNGVQQVLQWLTSQIDSSK